MSDNGFPDLGGTNEEAPCFIDEASDLDFRPYYVFWVVVLYIGCTSLVRLYDIPLFS